MVNIDITYLVDIDIVYLMDIDAIYKVDTDIAYLADIDITIFERNNAYLAAINFLTVPNHDSLVSN